MNILTWNVQWCRGVDGRVDPARILRTAREIADFDVLCLQEVARGFSDLEGSSGEDQFRLLAEGLPGYALIEGIATDRLGHGDGGGGRRQFGNALFTRLPLLRAFRHLLPWPPDSKVASMQRIAIEAVVETKAGPLRVTTTHLEYYSATQRMAQVGRLRGLQAEAASHAKDAQNSRVRETGPFAPAPRPASGVLTADFNFRPDQPEYALLQMPLEGSPRYRDAWAVKHGEAPHAPTVGLFDKKQWKGKPFCFDMMFVTEDIAGRVEDISVDAATDASDHQPVLLRLAD